MVGWGRVIDVVFRGFGHPPVDSAVCPGDEGGVSVSGPKGVNVFAVFALCYAVLVELSSWVKRGLKVTYRMYSLASICLCASVGG
jgi:hypothetical protein